MKPQSRAFADWRRQARRSRQRMRTGERGVVHFVRTGDPPAAGGRSRAGREVPWPAVRRFVVLSLVLLGCMLWLAALLAR